MAQDVDIELRFKLLEDVNKKVDKLSEAFDDLNKKRFSRLSGFFTKFSIGITGINQGLELMSKAFSAAEKAISPFIREASKIEDLEQQFATLTGSIENASMLLQDLQAFSARTPFQLEGIAQASRQLLAFGFSQDEVITRLSQLGDVAAASGNDLGELSTIFGQVQAAGKLTGERLLQFQERAVPIGPAIAETMGVAESAVKDLVSQGAVTFEQFDKAFKSLTESGGQFADGMARQSQTLSGRISTLKDNFALLQASIGKALLPVMKGIVTATTEFIQRNKELIKVKVVDFLLSFAKAVVGLIKIVARIPQQGLIAVIFGIDPEEQIQGIEDKIKALGQEIEDVQASGFKRSNTLLGFSVADTKKDVDAIKKQIEDLKNERDRILGKEGTGKLFKDLIDTSEAIISQIEKGVTSAGAKIGKKNKIEIVVSNSLLDDLKNFGLGFAMNFVNAGKKVKDLIVEAFNRDNVLKTLGGLSGSIAGGRGGAQALVGKGLDAAFGPGAGEIFKLFSMGTEEFRKAIDGFIDFFIDLPGILAENAAYFVERIIERTPHLINALVDALPIIITELSKLLTDPQFWIKVAESFVNSFLIIFSAGLIDSLQPLTDAVRPFADAVNFFADAIKSFSPKGLISGGGDFFGGVIGSVGSVFGLANGGDVPNLSRYSNDGFGPVMLDQNERVLTGSTGERLDRFLSKMETGGSNQSELIEAIKALNITLIANDVEIAKSVNRAVNDGFIIGRRG